MKRLLLLAVGLIFALGLYAQRVDTLFYDDFQDQNADGWGIYTTMYDTTYEQYVDSTITFYRKWHLSNYGGDYYLYASGYSGGAHYTVQYAITPKIGIPATGTTITMEFDNRVRYTPADSLKLFVSTDYTGDTLQFDQATWTEITPLYLDTINNDYNWRHSTIDLSNIVNPGDSVYFAFKYVSDSVNAGGWYVDSVQLKIDGNQFYLDDFQDQDVSDWTMYSPGFEIAPPGTDTVIHYHNWDISYYGGDYWLQASSYESGVYYPTVQWAITPMIDARKHNNIVLVFDNRERYTVLEPLHVLISTDFTGDSTDIMNATWTEITDLDQLDQSTGDYEWATSTIDLSNYSDTTFYIAFKYVSNNQAGGVWAIDSVLVKGDYVSAVNEVSGVNLTVYPNPVNRSLVIAADQNINKVEIYNTVGQQVKAMNLGTNTARLDVADLQPGVYMLRIYTSKGVSTQKILKR